MTRTRWSGAIATLAVAIVLPAPVAAAVSAPGAETTETAGSSRQRAQPSCTTDRTASSGSDESARAARRSWADHTTGGDEHPSGQALPRSKASGRRAGASRPSCRCEGAHAQPHACPPAAPKSPFPPPWKVPPPDCVPATGVRRLFGLSDPAAPDASIEWGGPRGEKRGRPTREPIETIELPNGADRRHDGGRHAPTVDPSSNRERTMHHLRQTRRAVPAR